MNIYRQFAENKTQIAHGHMKTCPTTSLDVIANLQHIYHFSLTGAAKIQSLVTCSIGKSTGNGHSHALLVGVCSLSKGESHGVYHSCKGLDPFTQSFILNIFPQMVFQDNIPGLIQGKPLGFRSESGLLWWPDITRIACHLGRLSTLPWTSGSLA